MISIMVIALLVSLEIVLCNLNSTLCVADVLIFILQIRFGLRHALFSCPLLLANLQVSGVFLTSQTRLYNLQVMIVLDKFFSKEATRLVVLLRKILR